MVIADTVNSLANNSFYINIRSCCDFTCKYNSACFTSVSQATRAYGSSFKIASKIASLIWSAIYRDDLRLQIRGKNSVLAHESPILVISKRHNMLHRLELEDQFILTKSMNFFHFYYVLIDMCIRKLI